MTETHMRQHRNLYATIQTPICDNTETYLRPPKPYLELGQMCDGVLTR